MGTGLEGVLGPVGWARKGRYGLQVGTQHAVLVSAGGKGPSGPSRETESGCGGEWYETVLFPSPLVPAGPASKLGPGSCDQGAQPHLPAGDMGTETKSLLEQLRGEALKFHKPGECEVPLPYVGPFHWLCAWSQLSVLQRTGQVLCSSLLAAGLGMVRAVLILYLQERTTRLRAMW